MKKIIMMVAAVLMLSAPATMAQKINAESYKAKMVKSDEAIQNEKKAAKAATWLSRAEVYSDAVKAPTESLFTGMDVAMLKITFGNPSSTSSETVADATYKTLVYPYLTIYTINEKVAGWKVTREIDENATDIAIEAYGKALELDPKLAPKVKDGLASLANYYAQTGDTSNILLDYVTGAEAYTKVFDIKNHPGCGDANPMMLYYAGYMYTIGANTDPSLYPAGVVAFNRAIEAGYPEMELADTATADENKGNIYYYLYHCYYGQKEADAANLQKAKAALISGVEKFPKNQRIIDALTQLYTIEEGMGDPSELIGIIDAAIESDPSNADLWYARGRVFFALQDYDNCIASFAKVTEIVPEVFDGHFYLGLFYIYKADALNDIISSKTYTENAEYEKDIKEANAVYAAAIPILERAYELKNDDLSTAEYLKSLCFRLRDEEGIMEKYTKYNEIYNSLKE